MATLAVLLGGDAVALVQTLSAMGYLQLSEVAAVAGSAIVPIGTTSTIATAEPTPSAPMQPPDAQQTEEDLQRQRPRAATNARLYLPDILQLQRNPVAVVLHRHLHAARAEEAISAAIAEALRALPQITCATYAARVRARIGELLPDALQAA